MPKDPFLIKESGGDIRDSALKITAKEIDGDILVAESYRKHPKINWQKFRNSRLIFFICLLVFTVLITKLYHLQIVLGAEYYNAAESNRIRHVPIIAPRGVIFDSRNQRLAYNVPDFALFIVPADLPGNQEAEDEMFSEIADTLNIDHFDLIESFVDVPRASYMPYEIARGLTQEQAIFLTSRAADWQGVFVKPIERRQYEHNLALSHVIGYTGKISRDEFKKTQGEGYNLNDYVGKTGIESIYQDYLRGQAGLSLIEVDSFGRQKNLVDKITPIAGDNVYLSIDADLQEFIWQELESTITKIKSPGGSVIVMDPRDGSILALASYPGYDSQQLAKGISAEDYQAIISNSAKPLFNRSISGEYPSGSTFKMIVGAGAINEGLIDKNFTINSVGGLVINGYRFPDWKAGGHGLTNITKALAESINSFFYTIGGGYGDFVGLGLEKIVKYGELFGLSQKTGIDLPAESAGFLPSRDWKLTTKGERWYLGDTYHLAIGQGDILVTPIQVANYTAAIANNGTIYQPRIVQSIQIGNSAKRIVEPVKIREKIVSQDAIDLIKKGLRDAVIYGSIRSLSALPVDVAGKTGTAEFGSGKNPHAWFTGFAPYQNPEIVVTVMIEEGVGGTMTATPIAKKIFEWYFNKQY